MEKSRKNIVIVEPSKFLFEGISTSIIKIEHDYTFFYACSLTEIEIIFKNKGVSVVIINPCLIQNKIHEFEKLKRQFPGVYWLGLVYCFFDKLILGIFDDIITITEDISEIVNKINQVCHEGKSEKKVNGSDSLSERESDVLKLLSNGLSNKEIADKLNISIHTVNTHRRNIMDKTGIRSVSGLTIYAFSKGLIKIEQF